MTDNTESDDTGSSARWDTNLANVAEESFPAPETTVVTMQFDAADPAGVLAALARYVVLARGHPGCRNIDLCASETVEARFVVISKWARPADQRAHFDSAELVGLARACDGLLARPAHIDLLTGLSAHDLA
jgi:quinol monooxygenase YgiN